MNATVPMNVMMEASLDDTQFDAMVVGIIRSGSGRSE